MWKICLNFVSFQMLHHYVAQILVLQLQNIKIIGKWPIKLLLFPIQHDLEATMLILYIIMLVFSLFIMLVCSLDKGFNRNIGSRDKNRNFWQNDQHLNLFYTIGPSKSLDCHECKHMIIVGLKISSD